MFIFKNKKKNQPVERSASEVVPKKSLESSLARALALENMLVAGYRSNKQNSKTTEKKYFKILNNPKIKFSEKVNVKNHIDFSFNPCK